MCFALAAAAAAFPALKTHPSSATSPPPLSSLIRTPHKFTSAQSLLLHPCPRISFHEKLFKGSCHCCHCQAPGKQPGCCRTQVVRATKKKKRAECRRRPRRSPRSNPRRTNSPPLYGTIALQPGEDHVALRSTTAPEPLSRENLPLLLTPCVSRNS